MKSIYFFIFLLGIALQTAFAMPDIQEKEVFYPIKGHSLQELRKNINYARSSVDGEFFDANTRCDITWKVAYQSEPHLCQLADVQIKANLVTRLPQWVEYESSSKELQQQWNEGLKRVKLHEEGHKNNGKIAALEIENSLHELSTMPNCQMLQQEVANRIQKIILDYKLKDKTYDEITHHGAKQA